MNFEDFKKTNNFKSVKCDCCAFCRWFESYQYDYFGGKCKHKDIEKEVCSSVNDFCICDKFEKV